MALRDADADLASLLAKLEDPDNKVRLSAVLALARRVEFRQRAADALLALGAREKDRIVRVTAVMSVARGLGDKRALPYVIDYLSDGQADVRKAAARTLAIPGLIDFTVGKCLRNLAIETLRQGEKQVADRFFPGEARLMAEVRDGLIALGLYSSELSPEECGRVVTPRPIPPERGGPLPNSPPTPLVPLPTDPDPARHNGGGGERVPPPSGALLLLLGAMGGGVLYLLWPKST